jgi:hypothetical protein
MTAPALSPVAAALTEAQRETLAKVFRDALANRRPQEDGCTGCENYPAAALCDDHAGDYDACDQYISLAADLGVSLED